MIRHRTRRCKPLRCPTVSSPQHARLAARLGICQCPRVGGWVDMPPATRTLSRCRPRNRVEDDMAHSQKAAHPVYVIGAVRGTDDVGIIRADLKPSFHWFAGSQQLDRLFERRSRTQGLDDLRGVVQTIQRDFPFLADDMPVLRIVRYLVFALVVACHAVVTLCGPCLHALPGSSHGIGSPSNSHRADDRSQSGRDSADNCLVCHFVAQGQLPVEFAVAPSIQQITDLVAPAVPASSTPPLRLLSSPRTPPFATVSHT